MHDVSLATYMFLYPLPLIMTAFGLIGLQKGSLFAVLIGGIGALLWYSWLGFAGTAVAILVVGIWYLLIGTFKILFS